jgi:hypothetical protein
MGLIGLYICMQVFVQKKISELPAAKKNSVIFFLFYDGHFELFSNKMFQL